MDATQATQKTAPAPPSPPSNKTVQYQPPRTISRHSVSSTRSAEKKGVFEQISELESQRTSSDAQCKEKPGVTENDEEEFPEEAGNGQADEESADDEETLGEKLARVRASTWWFIGAVLLAIPLIIFATVLRTKTLDGVKVVGLIVWLEIVWTAGWVAHQALLTLGRAWYRICQRSADTWEDLLTNTATGQLWFVLSLAAWGSSHIICHFSNDRCSALWIEVLSKILLATIAVTAMYLVKDIALEVIYIRQAVRMLEGRLGLIKRHFNAVNFLLAADTPNTSRLEKVVAKGKGFFSKLWSILRATDGSVLLRSKPPGLDDMEHQYAQYVRGLEKDDDFNIDGTTFLDRWRDVFVIYYSTITGQDLEDESAAEKSMSETDFRRLLSIPSVKRKNTRARLNDKPFTAAEMMRIMDRDANGTVAASEMAEVTIEMTIAIRNACKSINGIKRAIRSVDIVVSCLLLGVVAIIYAAFFVPHITTYLTPIWTTITGLSFALGGTVTEYINAFSFVFSKQPYDVGDRVIIEGKELIVDEVCLQYTIFHQCSDGAFEQIAHKKICDSWITNLTRSKILTVKETATVPENSSITAALLEEYSARVQTFVTSCPVRSRYLKDDLQVSLQSDQDDRKQLVAKMKLKEVIVRREDVLARVRNEVRACLEEVLSAPAATGAEVATAHQDEAGAAEKNG